MHASGGVPAPRWVCATPKPILLPALVDRHLLGIVTLVASMGLGLAMFGMDRKLWLVTVATTILLLGSMGIAMREGVG